MRRAILTVVAGTCFLCAAAPRPAMAQSETGLQISGGFTALHESLDDESFWDPGFRADVMVPLTSTSATALGVVGEISSNRNGTFDDSLMGILGGIRYTLHGNLEPFGQALVGVERCCDPNQTGFTFQLGAGVTKWFTGMLGVRGQFDFRRSKYSNDDGDSSLSYNEPIVGASVVFRFGGS